MNFLMHIFSLGIIFLAALPVNKRLCNAANEVSYSFRYAVAAEDVGVVTQQWEQRRGDIVQGSYSFLQPNGKIRVVDYQVNGKQGFKAAVRYRNPTVKGQTPAGHLSFPKSYRHPIVLAKPVGLITQDLFRGGRTYPNLPINN